MILFGDYREFVKYWYNVSLVFCEIVKMYEYVSEVVIWLYYFDIVSLIIVKFDDISNLEKMVGIGFVFVDNLCDEFYFYVNYWIKKSDISYDNLFSFFDGGVWKIDIDWKGVILKVFVIVKFKEGIVQYEFID